MKTLLYYYLFKIVKIIKLVHYDKCKHISQERVFMYSTSWIRFKRFSVTVFDMVGLIKLNDEKFNFNMSQFEEDCMKKLNEYLDLIDNFLEYMLNQIYFLMTILSEILVETKVTRYSAGTKIINGLIFTKSNELSESFLALKLISHKFVHIRDTVDSTKKFKLTKHLIHDYIEYNCIWKRIGVLLKVSTQTTEILDDSAHNLMDRETNKISYNHKKQTISNLILALLDKQIEIKSQNKHRNSNDINHNTVIMKNHSSLSKTNSFLHKNTNTNLWDTTNIMEGTKILGIENESMVFRQTNINENKSVMLKHKSVFSKDCGLENPLNKSAIIAKKDVAFIDKDEEVRNKKTKSFAKKKETPTKSFLNNNSEQKNARKNSDRMIITSPKNNSNFFGNENSQIFGETNLENITNIRIQNNGSSNRSSDDIKESSIDREFNESIQYKKLKSSHARFIIPEASELENESIKFSEERDFCFTKMLSWNNNLLHKEFIVGDSTFNEGGKDSILKDVYKPKKTEVDFSKLITNNLFKQPRLEKNLESKVGKGLIKRLEQGHPTDTIFNKIIFDKGILL